MKDKDSILLSWEKFKVFSNCRLHYYLRYIKSVKLSRDPTIFVPGRVVHNVAEAYVKSGFDDAILKKKIRAEFDKESAVGRYSRVSKASAARKAATASIETVRLFKELKFPQHNIRYEEWFRFPIPQRPKHQYNGGFDVYDPVREAVMDLKTNAPGYKADERQLLFYGVVLKAMDTTVKMIAFLYPLHKNRVDSRLLKVGELESFEETIIETLDEMDSDNLLKFADQATTGSHCFFCEFYRTEHCPKTFVSIKAEVKGKNKYEVTL